MQKLLIPQHINADGLIPFLDQLAKHSDADQLILDFSSLRRVSPAGLATLAAFVARRRKHLLPTHPEGLDDCVIRDYLRRMNLNSLCDWEQGEETFNRLDPAGMFVSLQPISHKVEELCNEIASCIAPGGDEYLHPNAGLYDTAFYLISEMANNVRQHSNGQGFVTLQTTRTDGFIKIAIADGGCGIPKSLIDGGGTWTQDLTDEDIIEQALVARVTSKGQPANEGVGLTLTSKIVDLMGGHILIASSGGRVIQQYNTPPKKEPFEGGYRFPGTLVAMTFRRNQAEHFDQKLHKAKELNNLLQTVTNKAIFRP